MIEAVQLQGCVWHGRRACGMVQTCMVLGVVWCSGGVLLRDARRFGLMRMWRHLRCWFPLCFCGRVSSWWWVTVQRWGCEEESCNLLALWLFET